MGKFIIRRLLWMTLVLFVVSLITFILMRIIPGGPFTGEKRLPAATLAQLNAKYRLDQPLYIQYLSFLEGVIVPKITTGKQSNYLDHEYLINLRLPFGDRATFRWMNFGPSYNSIGRTVSDIFRDNLPISMQLGFLAFTLSIFIGVPLGIISALKRNTYIDYLAMAIAVLGISVPVIIMAPILQYFFGVQLKLVPVSGWGKPNQMILPVIALGASNTALIARLTRASLLQVLGQDYIRTAKAKGLIERLVILRHALRNALIPIVTVLGPTLAYMLCGTFVVETIFGIPGMGKFFVTSVTGRDYQVIMGTVLLLAMFLVLANTIVDILYTFLDPRIRTD
ncbi:MAG: Oligopeptide transport system permease protein OppB [Anaerolineae bacterium]|nr:MAG: Oligopeptide transport system permease protein OppB [Anaerolineae bacterium]